MVNDDRFNIREELRTKELVKQDELRNVGSTFVPRVMPALCCFGRGTESEPPGGIIRCDSIYKSRQFAD